MILLRFNKIEGLYCDIEGGQDKYEYGKSNAGWFPIEGMNFGFRSQTESTTGTNAQGGANQGGNRQGQGGGRTSPPANQGGAPVSGGTGSGGAKKENDEAFTTISVSKFVDGVTTSLMAFAMEDRIVTKAERSKMRQADIHFLHSVMGDPSKQSQRYIFPYLMITLEHVLIKGWNITASGDDRPGESLELWYDKAAMRYYRTVDGKTWTGGDITGWDQYRNDKWEIPTGGEPKYFKQPDNL